jgi:hypothetical protein
MATDHNMLQEILARATRTETRLTRLCVAMGVDAFRGANRLTLVRATPPLVELVGLDTTIADILAFCRTQSIIAPEVAIMHAGQIVGSVAIPPATEVPD